MNLCIDHNGKIYESESEMCKAHGVSLSLYQSRRKNGLPLKNCLTPYKNPYSQGKTFTYNGKQYRSLKTCCDKLNILYHSVYQQINRNGLTPTEAIDKIIANNNKRKCKNVA